MNEESKLFFDGREIIPPTVEDTIFSYPNRIEMTFSEYNLDFSNVVSYGDIILTMRFVRPLWNEIKRLKRSGVAYELVLNDDIVIPCRVSKLEGFRIDGELHMTVVFQQI